MMLTGINQQFVWLFHQTNDFARNILHKNFTCMYILKNFYAGVTLSNFGRKMRDDAVDHKMDL